jgi:hypothetical protein
MNCYTLSDRQNVLISVKEQPVSFASAYCWCVYFNVKAKPLETEQHTIGSASPEECISFPEASRSSRPRCPLWWFQFQGWGNARCIWDSCQSSDYGSSVFNRTWQRSISWQPNMASTFNKQRDRKKSCLLWLLSLRRQDWSHLQYWRYLDMAFPRPLRVCGWKNWLCCFVSNAGAWFL